MGNRNAELQARKIASKTQRKSRETVSPNVGLLSRAYVGDLSNSLRIMRQTDHEKITGRPKATPKDRIMKTRKKLLETHPIERPSVTPIAIVKSPRSPSPHSTDKSDDVARNQIALPMAPCIEAPEGELSISELPLAVSPNAGPVLVGHAEHRSFSDGESELTKDMLPMANEVEHWQL